MCLHALKIVTLKNSQEIEANFLKQGVKKVITTDIEFAATQFF